VDENSDTSAVDQQQEMQDDDNTNFLDPLEAEEENRTLSQDNRNGTLISRTNLQNLDIVRETVRHERQAELEPQEVESSDSEESEPVRLK
jgi:hypothetical protein